MLNAVLWSAVFIFGLIIGSFLNVCIYRIPNQISIATPPSRCPSCETRLKPIDLVPVFSWIFLGGKCRYCHKKISIRYMMVELLCGILFLAVYLIFGFDLYVIPALILTAILITITFIDIDTQTIPNGIIIFGLICAATGIFTGISPAVKDGYFANMLDGLLGALVGSVPLLLVNIIARLLLKREGMGGGDMKLMFMVGFFLGLKLTLIALILAIYIGGIFGAIILIRNRRNNKNEAEDESKSDDQDIPQNTGHYMPFGPFLAIGSFISMLVGSNILQWYLNLLNI